jgi:hypothetical protein
MKKVFLIFGAFFLLIGGIVLGVFLGPKIKSLFTKEPEVEKVVDKIEEEEDDDDIVQADPDADMYAWYEDEFIRFQYPKDAQANFTRRSHVENGETGYIESITFSQDNKEFFSVENSLTLFGVGGHGYEYDLLDPLKLKSYSSPEETIYNLSKKPTILKEGDLSYMYLQENDFAKSAIRIEFSEETALPTEESYFEELLLIKLVESDNNTFIGSPIASAEDAIPDLDFFNLNENINDGTSDIYYIKYNSTPGSLQEAKQLVKHIVRFFDTVERKKW